LPENRGSESFGGFSGKVKVCEGRKYWRRKRQRKEGPKNGGEWPGGPGGAIEACDGKAVKKPQTTQTLERGGDTENGPVNGV